MCGIIGMFGSTTHVQTSAKRAWMIEALYLDALRGMDSTGLAMLPTAATRKPEVYKRALGGPDFIEKKTTLRMLSNIGQSNGCIGHNRSTTRGAITDDNAHPFQYKHITLVHNGTVNNSDWLLKRKSEADSNVDSAQVAWSFSEAEADELLPHMTGGFSLVWWDSRDGTLHFARNTEKPMYWLVAEDAKMMFFGSELGMIRMLLDRHGIKFKKTSFYTAPYKHYVYKNPFNVEEYDTRPFQNPASKSKKRGGQYPAIPNHTNHSIQRGGPLQHSSQLALPAGTSKTSTSSTKTTSDSTSDTDTEGVMAKAQADAAKIHFFANRGKKHPAETETLSRGLVAAITDNMQTKDRKKHTQALAEAEGIEAFKTISARPVYWRPYKEETRLGTLFLRTDDVNIQVFNVSLPLWIKCASMGSTPIEIKGTRLSYGIGNGTDHGSTNVFVAEINFDLFTKLYDNYERNQKVTRRVPSGEGGDIEMVEIGTLKPRMVTIEDFNEAVEHGCFNCCHTIILADAPDIMWYGPNEEWPICGECSKQPLIRSEWEKLTANKDEDVANAPAINVH